MAAMILVVTATTQAQCLNGRCFSTVVVPSYPVIVQPVQVRVEPVVQTGTLVQPTMYYRQERFGLFGLRTRMVAIPGWSSTPVYSRAQNAPQKPSQ